MRNEDDYSTFEAEQEILAILSHMQVKDTTTKPAVSPVDDDDDDETDVIPAAPDTTVADIPLILTPDVQDDPSTPVQEQQEKTAATPDVKALVTDTEDDDTTEQSPFAKVGKGFCGLFPRKGDPVSEIVRKCIFLLSLLVFIVSLGFLTYYMVLEPGKVNKENDSYVALFNDTEGNAKAETSTETQNIQPSFRQLYSINKDIAGWLAFNSTDSDKFMNINLPVVWCGNNDTYLSRGFDGKYSRSGTLFFEQTNTFKEGTSNKVAIIYGHNMASGTMFASLNKLIGNVYRARSAAIFKLDTLYESNQYKVFAVIVSDEGADTAHRFGYLRTSFADDADFMDYVSELRARSLFDYPVDVLPTDELVILSTCTNKSQVKVADGRFAVIARRVRKGENATTDTAKIVKNDDVIMPYAWYTAQSLTPHAFYTQDDFVIPDAVTGGGTTTNGTATTTTETTDTTEQTTTANGTTDTTAGTTTDTTTDTTVQTTVETTADTTDQTTQNTTIQTTTTPTT